MSQQVSHQTGEGVIRILTGIWKIPIVALILGVLVATTAGCTQTTPAAESTTAAMPGTTGESNPAKPAMPGSQPGAHGPAPAVPVPPGGTK